MLPVYVPVTLRQRPQAIRARGNLIGQMVVPLPIGASEPGRQAAADRCGNRQTEGEEPPISRHIAEERNRAVGSVESPGPATGERDHR